MRGQLQQRLRFVDRDPFEHHRLEQARHLRLVETGRQLIGRSPLHVRPEPAVLGVHREAVELADRLVALRRSQQLERLVDGELVGREVVGHAGRVVAALDVRAVLAGFHHDEVAVGIVAERERVDRRRVDLVEVLLDEPLEPRQRVVVAEVEPREPLVLLAAAGRDRVEVLLDLGRELVVDEVVEVLFEQADDGERGPGRDQRLTLLPHVAAVLDRLDDRGPRRRVGRCRAPRGA